MRGIRGLGKNCDKRLPARGAERRQAHTHYNRATRCGVTAAARFGRGARHGPIRSKTRTARFGRARLSALHRGFPRAALGCTRFGPGRASRGQAGRALPGHHPRLSQAPGTPTLVSRGSIPGPPGSRVTSPARRNRSHPISRLSPVTPLKGGMGLCTYTCDYCQAESAALRHFPVRARTWAPFKECRVGVVRKRPIACPQMAQANVDDFLSGSSF